MEHKRYFSNLNPIAVKIARDVDAIKDSYDQLWDSFKAKEQEEIINETLIKPEIEIMYYQHPKIQDDCLCSHLYDKRNLRTFVHQTIASKIVHDDTIGSFRDEHSAPFSYRTRSQINLAIASDEDNTYEYPSIGDEQKSNVVPPLTKNSKMKTNFAGHEKSRKLSYTEGVCGNEVHSPISNPHAHTTIFTQSDSRKQPANVSHISNQSENRFEQINTNYFGSRSRLTERTSSSAGSTDDEDNNYHDHDKALYMENVKLLDSDSEIRKGFDFLNNW